MKSAGLRPFQWVCLAGWVLMLIGPMNRALAGEADHSSAQGAGGATSQATVEWMGIGPGMSGYCEKLWCHPTRPGVLFLGPDMHVAYGSWDGGQSWESMRDADGLGREMKRVLEIDFSRQDERFGLALDWNGWIYETTDTGRTWTKLGELSPGYAELGVDPYDPNAFRKGWYDEQLGTRLSTLAVDPSNDAVWYVGAGDFWNVKENHRSAARPQGGGLSYADYGYILKSTDRGRTWTKITADFPEDLDVGRIIVDPRDPARLVMATNHGLLRSVNGGLTWAASATGLPNNLPRDLRAFYSGETGQFVLFLIEQTVYEPDGDSVRSTGGLYRSDDCGRTWTSVTGNLALDLGRLNYPAEAGRYYRAISHWLGLTEKEARNRFPRLPSSILPVFNRVAVHPENPLEIYLTYNKKHDRTFGPGDVWRSLDGGQTWTVVARHGSYWHSGRDADYWQERNNPTGPNVTFSHLQDYLDREPELCGNRLLEFDSTGNLYISIDQQIHRSTNKGESWHQIDDVETSPGSNLWIGRGNSNLPGRFMLLETVRPDRRLLASGEHGLWQITGFNGWDGSAPIAVEQIEGQRHIDGMVSISTLAVHPGDPDRIFLLSWRQNHAGKLRGTTDGGKTWSNIATIFEQSTEPPRTGKVIQGPPGLLPAQNSLLIDPENPDRMYFVATRDAHTEVYRAPRRQPAKGGFGFYRSLDGGRTWELHDKGFHEGASLRRLALDPARPSTLYVAANDRNGGLFKSTDHGSNWTRMDIPSGVRSVNNVFVDRNSGSLYIATGGFYEGGPDEGGAWRSTDGGATWQRIFESPLVLQVESSPLNPDLLVLNTGSQMRTDPQFLNPGVYLSLDGGDSWKKVNHGLGNHDKIIDAKPDPCQADILWAASWGSGWHIGKIRTEQPAQSAF